MAVQGLRRYHSRNPLHPFCIRQMATTTLSRTDLAGFTHLTVQHRRGARPDGPAATSRTVTARGGEEVDPDHAKKDVCGPRRRYRAGAGADGLQRRLELEQRRLGVQAATGRGGDVRAAAWAVSELDLPARLAGGRGERQLHLDRKLPVPA